MKDENIQLLKRELANGEENSQLMKAFPTILGPTISVTKTKFTVEMGESSDKKYFSDGTLVIGKNGDVIARSEADIELVLRKLRAFLEQFR